MSAIREGESYRWVGPLFVLLPCNFFRAELEEPVAINGSSIDRFYLQARNEEEATVFAKQAAGGFDGAVVQVEECDREELFSADAGCYIPNASEYLALLLAGRRNSTSSFARILGF